LLSSKVEIVVTKKSFLKGQFCVGIGQTSQVPIKTLHLKGLGLLTFDLVE